MCVHEGRFRLMMAVGLVMQSCLLMRVEGLRLGAIGMERKSTEELVALLRWRRVVGNQIIVVGLVTVGIADRKASIRIQNCHRHTSIWPGSPG